MISEDLSRTSALPGGGSASTLEAVHLREKVANAILKLREGRNRNRKRATALKVATVTLTGIASLVLGIDIGQAQFQRQLAFAIVSLATLINAIEPFFTFRGLWIDHEVAQWKMHRLQDELEYYLSTIDATRHPDPSVLAGFNNRYIEVWDHLGDAWITRRRRAES